MSNKNVFEFIMNSMFFGLSLHFFYEVMMGFILGGGVLFNGFGGFHGFGGWRKRPNGRMPRNLRIMYKSPEQGLNLSGS
jgi:hypothetical protein